MEITEERVSELEDRSIEMIQSEQQRVFFVWLISVFAFILFLLLLLLILK